MTEVKFRIRKPGSRKVKLANRNRNRRYQFYQTPRPPIDLGQALREINWNNRVRENSQTTSPISIRSELVTKPQENNHLKDIHLQNQKDQVL
jgi:hypothetical protein